MGNSVSEHKVLIEQTRLLYQQGYITQIFGFFTAAVTVSMFYGVINSNYLLLWFVFISLLSAIRVYSAYRFNTLDINDNNIIIWKNRYILETFLSGVLWGLLSLFYEVTWPISHQVILFIVYTGLLAGSFNTNSSVLYAFPAFFIPVVLSLSYMGLSGFEDNLFQFFSLLAIYLIIMGMSSARYYKHLKETLELRFLNEDLAKELYDSNLRLKELTEIDELTQIYNRRTMNRYLADEWKRMFIEQKPLSVIMADIDYFKQYNDNYGHGQGDKCLIEVAKLLQNILEPLSGIVARLGGEEFAIILPDTSSTAAMIIAKKIQNALLLQSIPHQGSAISSQLTMSLGVATIVPIKDQDEDRLLKLADDALYKAKDIGRNHIVNIDLDDA